jgi:hypothetical protein
MVIEEDGGLSPEDEVLWETSINRHRRKLDGPMLIFIAILVGISMLAGFFGGIPAALWSSTCAMH